MHRYSINSALIAGDQLDLSMIGHKRFQSSSDACGFYAQLYYENASHPGT
jgi:hypothetical protein